MQLPVVIGTATDGTSAAAVDHVDGKRNCLASRLNRRILKAIDGISLMPQPDKPIKTFTALYPPSYWPHSKIRMCPRNTNVRSAWIMARQSRINNKLSGMDGQIYVNAPRLPPMRISAAWWVHPAMLSHPHALSDTTHWVVFIAIVLTALTRARISCELPAMMIKMTLRCNREPAGN